MTDIRIYLCLGGNLCQLESVTAEAWTWIEEHVSYEPWQSLGPRLAVEIRFLEPLVEGVIADGLTVSIP